MTMWKWYRSAFRQKDFVFILSAMRSGSTLLKSLLATAPEISHLPEIHYHKYKILPEIRLAALAKEPIIVLKKPSWLGENDYPRFPAVSRRKSIVLVRHPYTTLLSIKNMQASVSGDHLESWSTEVILDYWIMTYKNLASLKDDHILLRYHDLVHDPIAHTARIFRYLSLDEHAGVDTYQPPKNYQWAWYNDDGGDKIKSLTVRPSPVDVDQDLLSYILSYKDVPTLLTAYGYEINPDARDFA